MIETLKTRGVAVHGPVSDEGMLKLALLADPDSNQLHLAETQGTGG